MNVKRLFWKIWLGNPAWCDKWLRLHYSPDQIDGIMCFGVTLFGYSLVYSDVWL